MSEITPIERAKSLLDKFFKVKPIKCPHFAGERACVSCERRDSCTSIEIKREEYENVKLLVAGNSAILSIALSLKTDIEQFVLLKLVNSLSREQGFPTIKPEEGFDLTFYTDYGQINSQEQQFVAIIKILDLLLENPWVEVKMLINKWIIDVIEKLNLQIQRDLPKATLKLAPKVEKSKIFEPKYKVLAEQPTPIREERVVEPPVEKLPRSTRMIPRETAVQQVSRQEISEPTSIISESDMRQNGVKTEPLSPPSQEFERRSKIPKQAFFLTAEERNKEHVNWPPNIKRKEPGEEEPITIQIPSVTEVTKKVGPEKSTIAESHIPKGDKFELKIYEKKQAEDKQLPPMPIDDAFKILTYLEQLVKSDYEMRKIAGAFGDGMEKIEQMMFYTDFLTEMNKVTDMLRKAEPGLTLSNYNREDILKKILKWKASPSWKSSVRKEKKD